jgi:hypothetical protein
VSPYRWQEVERLYNAALERDPGVRAAFLAADSGGDEELLHEVQSLLKQQTDSRLDRPAWESAGEESRNDDTRFAVGTKLAQYRIETALGAGGMGEVSARATPG